MFAYFLGSWFSAAGACAGMRLLAVLLAPPAPAQNANDGFDPNANGVVYALAVQVDGKLVVGGSLTPIAGQSRIGATENRLVTCPDDPAFDFSLHGLTSHDSLVLYRAAILHLCQFSSFLKVLQRCSKIAWSTHRGTLSLTSIITRACLRALREDMLRALSIDRSIITAKRC